MKTNWKDLIGTKIGGVTVIGKDESNTESFTKLFCQCECGNIMSIRLGKLIYTPLKSCGCKNRPYEHRWNNLIGKKFGRWVVLERDFSFVGNYIKMICKCECGVISSVESQSLIKGKSTNCGCIGNKSVLEGKVIGVFIVLEMVGIGDDGHTLWKCKCNLCNNEIILPQHHIKINKSCGCQFRKPEGIPAFNDLFNRYKKSAQSRNLSFELTEEQFKKLTTGNCNYCGESLSNTVEKIRRYPSGKVHISKYKYNGIDRIDSEKGYVINNVVSCCKNCNWIKGKKSVEEFVNHINKIYLHLSKDNDYVMSDTCADNT